MPVTIFVIYCMYRTVHIIYIHIASSIKEKLLLAKLELYSLCRALVCFQVNTDNTQVQDVLYIKVLFCSRASLFAQNQHRAEIDLIKYSMEDLRILTRMDIIFNMSSSNQLYLTGFVIFMLKIMYLSMYIVVGTYICILL